MITDPKLSPAQRKHLEALPFSYLVFNGKIENKPFDEFKINTLQALIDKGLIVRTNKNDQKIIFKHQQIGEMFCRPTANGAAMIEAFKS
jgi:hypothetical protein